MATNSQQKPAPLLLRDFSRGRVSKLAANAMLVPPNSVANCLNVNFDTILGSAVVRAGTTLLGAAVAANKTPLGLAEYVSSGASTNNVVGVYSGASTASIYYYNGTSWATSNITSLNNTAKNRFAMLGNQMFVANGQDTMRSSHDGGITWGTTNSIDSGGTIKPSLVFRTKSRLIASGDSSQSRSRVFFSSIVDPTTSPGSITWNTNSATGDWIDINPDDGSDVTAFAEVSNQVLVFKTNGLYRLDVVSKTVDTQSIYDVGAVSQEAVVTCRGYTYFFSGIDINRTDGGYPQQISRLGVQDFIDAMPQSGWASVVGGTDGFNVYFSIGTVTLYTNKNEQRTYTNVVLKFSTRDETWTVHTYAQLPLFYARYTSSANGRKMISADTSGSVQTVGVGTTDKTSPIYFELETQEQEFGNRAHKDSIANLLTVFTNYGVDSQLQVKEDDRDFEDVVIDLDKRVNVDDGFHFEGNFLTFKWSGNSSSTAPIFEGIYIEDINDEGLITDGNA